MEGTGHRGRPKIIHCLRDELTHSGEWTEENECCEEDQGNGGFNREP